MTRDMIDSTDEIWASDFLRFPLCMSALGRLVFPKSRWSEVHSSLTVVETMMRRRENAENKREFAATELSKASFTRGISLATVAAVYGSVNSPALFIEAYIGIARSKSTATVFRVARLLSIPDLTTFNSLLAGKKVTMVIGDISVVVETLN